MAAPTIDALIARMIGYMPEVDAAGRAALLAATGGWPAGMGLSPAGREAYLDEQVLQPLAEELRSFLLRAALLDAFDAPLCEDAFGFAPDPARDEQLVRLHLVERLGEGQLAVLPPLRASCANGSTGPCRRRSAPPPLPGSARR